MCQDADAAGEPYGRAVTSPAQLHETIRAALEAADIRYDSPGEGQFFVTLPGTHKLATHCWLVVGRHALLVEAFVVRKPDESAEEFYRFLLRRNARTHLALGAVEHAARFSWTSTATGLLATYREALQDRLVPRLAAAQ